MINQSIDSKNANSAPNTICVYSPSQRLDLPCLEHYAELARIDIMQCTPQPQDVQLRGNDKHPTHMWL
jgi:hypothetical protein